VLPWWDYRQKKNRNIDEIGL